MAYTHSDLQGALPLLATGKVRDLYQVDASTLLFVATDRISAYDVIMENGIPNKGIILTLLSAHWFTVLQAALPDLHTHFQTLSFPASLPHPSAPPPQPLHASPPPPRIPPRSHRPRLPDGSAWTEYQHSGTVHGRPMPAGLRESEAFPMGPIYTPSTKAPSSSTDPGAHDENITTEQAAALIGAHHASRIEHLALRIYAAARDYAWARGLIIADTKFEFGLDEAADRIVLVDEVLTPDSSRFWPRDGYVVGRAQTSFDKQFLRDWLARDGLKGKGGVVVPEDVVRQTGEKYRDVFEILTGRRWVRLRDEIGLRKWSEGRASSHKA